MPELLSAGGIQVRNLSVMRGGRLLYNHFNIDFCADEITALLAPSGSGKTTLLMAIAGLIPTDSGSIVLPENHISFLFQEPRLLPWYTIEENLRIVLSNCFSQDEVAVRISRYLDKAGILQHQYAFPDDISGGERQRAAIARAFSYPAPVLLLDEAFQSQDLKSRLQLMAVLERLLSDEPRTVVLVTHDVREALCLADRIVVMEGEPLHICCDIRMTIDHTVSIQNRYLYPEKEALRIEQDLLFALC